MCSSWFKDREHLGKLYCQNAIVYEHFIKFQNTFVHLSPEGEGDKHDTLTCVASPQVTSNGDGAVVLVAASDPTRL